MKNKLSRFYPYGFDGKREILFAKLGIIASVLLSFNFFIRFNNELNQLYSLDSSGQAILDTTKVMLDFRYVLRLSFMGFPVLIVCMLGFIIYHYAYHYQGSKSIYLMKRLPKKGDIHIRCLTVPVVTIAVCVILMMVLLVIYYQIYMTYTPEECLTPYQWEKLWRNEL